MDTPPIPPLHLITDDGVVARPDFLDLARTLLEAGGPRVALHLRGRGTGGARLYAIAAALGPAAHAADALCVVNDRADVALASGFDGVHLGAEPMSVDEARRLMGADAVVGVSVHSPEEATSAARAGASFLIAGMLFASASHPEKRGSGVEWLRDITADGPPVVGIGGIDPARVASVLGAGASGVAVLGGIWHAPRPLSAMNDYLAALEAA